jgi:hypothetical protein
MDGRYRSNPDLQATLTKGVNKRQAALGFGWGVHGRNRPGLRCQILRPICKVLDPINLQEPRHADTGRAHRDPDQVRVAISSPGRGSAANLHLARTVPTLAVCLAGLGGPAHQMDADP